MLNPMTVCGRPIIDAVKQKIWYPRARETVFAPGSPA
jgi:hypothetical protein